MNSINLVGRLTADPELKTTQSGISVCTFSLAVNRPRVKDATDFINCVAWRQSAEYLCNYGRKGNLVAVSGVLTSRKYDDSNGNHRVSYEVVCDTLNLCESRSNSHVAQTPTQTTNDSQRPNFWHQTAQQSNLEEIAPDEDLPF